jgi:hypothetical protein
MIGLSIEPVQPLPYTWRQPSAGRIAWRHHGEVAVRLQGHRDGIAMTSIKPERRVADD